MHSKLSICIFVTSEPLAEAIDKLLSDNRYIVKYIVDKREFFEFIDKHKHKIDCLILQHDRALQPLVNWLYEQGIMLPMVICCEEFEEIKKLEANALDVVVTNATIDANPSLATYLYHPGEVKLPILQLYRLEPAIEEAIAKFVKLGPNYQRPEESETNELTDNLIAQTFLMKQRERLADKLKERLGYLGVYYKRNPEYFFRHLSRSDKQKLLETLASEYRAIIVNYFTNEDTLNQQIDNFVNMAFFADLPVAQIVEIHMELMEQLSKQLKLEGRSDDILLDYRLTLIDMIAHLCEMYRRCIPRDS